MRWIKDKRLSDCFDSPNGRWSIIRHYKGGPWSIADMEPEPSWRTVWVEHKGKSSWKTIGAAKAVGVLLRRRAARKGKSP